MNLDYYQRPFYIISQNIASEILKQPHSKRKSYWSLVPEREYDYVQSKQLIETYYSSILKEIEKVVSSKSRMYWLHLSRRILPSTSGKDKSPVTIGVTRKIIDGAIEKYAKDEFCNCLGITGEINISEVFDGLLLSAELEYERELLKNLPRQIVLTKFNQKNMLEYYTLQNLSMQIVVDGAQLRLDPEDIQNYLNKGYIVSITGSKYFTGPPYSGALIVPKNISKSINSIKKTLPTGLNYYYNHTDWPTSWLCSNNLSDGFNYGSYMRWNAAIVEMNRYYKTPILYRNLGIEMFCNFVEDSIKDSAFLEPLFKDETKINSYNTEEFGLRNIRTIFPFFILKDNEVLNVDQVKKIYTLLNSDLSEHFKDSSLEIMRLAAQKCHIGQAVNVKYGNDVQSAILRISLGARVISESWINRDISIFFRNIEAQMSQITVIIKKIELILNKPELFK